MKKIIFSTFVVKGDRIEMIDVNFLVIKRVKRSKKQSVFLLFQKAIVATSVSYLLDGRAQASMFGHVPQKKTCKLKEQT